MVDGDLVLFRKPGRLYLEREGIEVTTPEPVGRAKLHVVGVNRRDFRQSGEKAPSLSAVLQAKGNIRDSVGDRANIVGGKRRQVVQCRLPGMDEMAETTLRRETARQPCKPLDKPPDGGINTLQREALQRPLPLHFVPRVGDELPGF